MEILAIIILLLMFAYAWLHNKDLVAPAFVTSGVWLVLLVIYAISDHELYEQSDKFYMAVLLWVIPFCLFAFLMQKIKIPIYSKISGDVNQRTLKKLKPFLLLILLIGIFSVYYRGMLYNSENVFSGIRQASVETLHGEESLVVFPAWVNIATNLITLVVIISLYLLFIKKEYSTYSIVLFILVVLYTLLRSNKVVLSQLGFAFICLQLYNKKVSKKQLLILISILGGFFLLSQLMRMGEDSRAEFELLKFIELYLLSPLPAFDSVLNLSHTMIESFHGEYTFRAFVDYLQYFNPSITGNSDPFNLNNWTYTPMPTNVYTCMFPYYADFGYMGIILFSSFIGGVSGLLYTHMKQGYVVSTLIYTCLFYTLAFQFFADFIFQFFMVIIFYIIFSVFLVLKFKTHN